MTKSQITPHDALHSQRVEDDYGNPRQEGLTTPDQRSETRRHGFFVSDIGILLPPDLVTEVAEGLPVCQLPNTPHWLCGMTNLRGNIVPVFDLGVLLNIPRSIKKIRPGKDKRKQLFLQIEDEWIGFYSDGLPVRLILKKEHLLNTYPPMPDGLKPYVRSCYKQDNIWLDCDIENFFISITGRY